MPNDLRAAFEYAAQCWYADGMVNGREYGELADALLAVLSSHPEAVLSLLGTVHKGWLVDYADAAEKAAGYTDWGVAMVPPTVPDDYPHEPVYVVSLAETAKD